MIAVMSVDGFIARSSQERINWSSPEDRQFFADQSQRAGVVVMGANTIRAIGHALPGRRTIVYSRRDFDMEGVETTQEEPKVLLARLEREGHTEVAIGGGSQIFTMFLQAGVMNEIYLSVDPSLFGGGARLLGELPPTRLELLETSMLGQQTVLLHYRVLPAGPNH